ncbi:hypothetical protein [Maricaulis alexandrii]|uniref:hypothetical protein n=1 Tax=Maricaulis alexandrii TaxID=2570354 RepID=UPI001109AE7D|nr:hypothetical protein [Maricaulis alexandrii]
MTSAAVFVMALLATTSHAVDVCEAPCTLIEIADDGSYSVTMLGQDSRSTPSINANIVDGQVFDIDGDGSDERVIIDDRESAFGSVTAVFVDISTGEPFIAFQCQATTVDAVQEECTSWYNGLEASQLADALDRVHASTRVEGALDWETQYLLIPNITTQSSMMLAIQAVELARAQRTITNGSTEALEMLREASLFREQRALRFTFAD